jgi:hypothetical protein
MANTFPNLFIPGAGKSGTSALHELLNFHPEICMSSIKEPHYWTHPNFDSYSEQDQANYLALFKDMEDVQFKGESSTGYMQFPMFIDRIKAHYKQEPKFIFILRNPIDRCYSHYWWLKGLGSEREEFKDAVLKDFSEEPSHETNLPEGNYKNYYQFGLYGKWLSRFYQNFSEDNIMIITSEKLRENSLEAINQCYSFLNLAELDFIPETVSNKTVILKYPALYKFTKRLAFKKFNLPQSLKNTIPQGLKRFFRKELMESVLNHTKTDKTYPDITKENRAFLKEQYEEDIKKLKMITGMNFREWTDFNN